MTQDFNPASTSETASSSIRREAPFRPESIASVDRRLQVPTVGRSVTVARPAEELYAYWRNWTRLAKLCGDIKIVDGTDEHQTRGVITRDGADYKLTGVIDEDIPNRRLVWHMQVESHPAVGGILEFSPAAGERGTVTTVRILERRHSKTMERLERLFQGDAQSHAMGELRRFKQWIETGEIATAQPPAAAPRA